MTLSINLRDKRNIHEMNAEGLIMYMYHHSISTIDVVSARIVKNMLVRPMELADSSLQGNK